jgi:hypothetical protein
MSTNRPYQAVRTVKNDAPGGLWLVRPDPYRVPQKGDAMMTPIGGLIGSGMPTFVTPLGATSVAMGMLVLALLVTATLVIVVASRRKGS